MITVPLKAVAEVRFSSVDKKTVEGQVPVRLCNYTDVYYNDRILADMPFMEATATPDQVAQFSLRQGDVLLTKDSETADDIGVSAVVAEDLPGVLCGYHLAIARPRRRTDGRFLRWALAAAPSRGQLEVAATGVTRFGLRQDAVAGMAVPAPALSVQRAIADYLDTETARIDGLVETRRRQLAVLDLRRRAVVDGLTVPAALGGRADPDGHWRVGRLKRAARFFADGDWVESPFITSDGIRLIQTGNIGEGEYRDQGFRFITTETFVALDCTEVVPGDILISRLAGTVGRACLAPDLGTRMIVSVDVVIMRPTADLDPRFAVAYLSSTYHLELAELLARGTTMARLSRSQVGEFPIPLPPFADQRRIADEISRRTRSIRSATNAIQRQIDLLLERRQALITAAVTGQLEIPGVAA